MTDKLTAETAAPPSIALHQNSAGPVMIMRLNGKIELVEDADPTKAAEQCIEAMSGMIQTMIENAVDAREALIVAWLRKRRMHHIPDLIENGEHLK